MPHDQVWKQLLWLFFRDFMALFFERAAGELDFGRMELLDKEQFTDLPEGRRREADLVVKVHTREGRPELILIHVEVQRDRSADMGERMFEYYCMLLLRHRVPVFPVVVYLCPGAGGLTVAQHENSVFGLPVCRFNNSVVGLPDLDAETYLETSSALGPALSALMKSPSAGRVLHKLRALKRLAGAGVDEARRSLLVHVVGTYLELSEVEETQLVRLVEEPNHREVREMVNIYEQRAFEKGVEHGIQQGVEKGIEKGIERGVAEGLLQGQRRALLSLLERRFGHVPTEVAASVRGIRDSERLDDLMARVLDVRSLDEMGL